MAIADRGSPAPVGEEDEGRSIEVDSLDVRLPCRIYEVSYQLADAGRFSLTTEFLLRLLKAVDSLPENDLSGFFAFTREEMAYVVSSAERYEYVVRSGGKVRLTEKGASLFEIGSDVPSLYDVKKRSGRFAFDLVSFCPVRGKMLSNFESKLPELPTQNTEEISDASDRIGRSFKENFREALSTAGMRNIERTSLYSIDIVQARERVSALVPFSIKLKKDDWLSVEPDVIDWQPDSSPAHRHLILNSCASVVRDCSEKFSYFPSDGSDYLHECAPSIIEKYYRENRFNAAAFLKRASALAGELRSDRPTARIYGTLWTRKNFKTIMNALRYGSGSDQERNRGIIWLRSAYPFWGCSARMPDIVNELRGDGKGTGESRGAKAVLISQEGERDSWRFKNLFDHVVKLEQGAVPRDFELLLAPGRFFAALAYVSVAPSEGWRVPLGIISFDKSLLEGAHELAADLVDNVTAHSGDNLAPNVLKRRISEMLQCDHPSTELAKDQLGDPPPE
jgi:hypothetical protein